MYPKIELIHNKEYNYYEIGETTTFKVILYLSENNFQDVTKSASVFVLDEFNAKISTGDVNVVVNDDDEEEVNVIDSNLDNVVITTEIIKFVEEGSCNIKALLPKNQSPNNKALSVTENFVCYDSFFKNNYLTNMFSDYDVKKIKNNVKVKAIMDSLMEMVDVMYAYQADIKNITNPLYTKYNFLEVMSKSLGLEKVDFTYVDTENELDGLRKYRELLKNFTEVVRIRGTDLAYQTFFNALGYTIKIDEFWYDLEGNLIEIDPVNLEDSTYYAYTKDGIAIDIPQIPRPDPRKFASVGDNFAGNKSNYLRATISNLDGSGLTLTQEQRNLIKYYLEFLRPQHMQYLTEILRTDIAQEFLDALDNFEDSFISIIILRYNDIIEELYDIWGLSDTEKMIVGDFTSVTDEETSWTILWDSGEIWDAILYDLTWDQRSFFLDTITIEEL